VAHSLSAQKRVRQNLKQRTKNRAVKSELKSEIRKFNDLIHDRKITEATDFLKRVYKELDQDTAKGVIHKNTASRKKSRLTVKLANASKVAAPK
jgi:small subunit ribosomal protein S20